ncbi:23S rRNA (cytidine(2498)-2'-O)-methyltransferase RlmM [Celerinatantimonas diazotrophica]|uniref:Ribosomal RNA large subunit methyltransferase M n=1 Tax=Celerinatantimonas diazotrophica TaxID=412034 RepID=A0A4R1J9H7_9GAMM|nr:23S rRNA (cytidine(2498)-2'-O)-methyltransferase RlmM [Celerinatantimonas diazotrophica]TCK47265.1 23S rRNA (cytidine2498-2'-O)-methyltransferase [Celerinatantimonas diazotrophica]CAG9296037.1 Ribosomal RNA large subunit methyltransferase M [Celerinatantimonas diazotrophica]
MARSLLLSCRGGFENDCAAEMQQSASQLQVAGFARTKPNQGYVVFECFNENDADYLHRQIDFRSLVFARQWQVITCFLELDESDRISPIIESLETLPDVCCVAQDWPDTNDGKQMSGFCRKFSRPLEKKLCERMQCQARAVLQLFWLDGRHVYVGYRLVDNSSTYPMGILRLRQSSEAPSRSTLKLDEAFAVLLNDDEREQYVQNAQHAVDLGACPGGWTYQLVRRNMYVAAVDNGPMAENLMQSGLVKHYREDGFKYVPERNNISWLVCDMVEKPSRVTRLMLKWLTEGWCRYAMFNLKLPMKKRYAEIAQDLQFLRQGLEQTGQQFELRAKHLYHDREEVTVFACLHR